MGSVRKVHACALKLQRECEAVLARSLESEHEGILAATQHGAVESNLYTVTKRRMIVPNASCEPTTTHYVSSQRVGKDGGSLAAP
jgi:hypothetical protein